MSKKVQRTKDKPTKKEIREDIAKFFVTGKDILLGDGKPGVFVRYGVGKARAWVLVGGMDGGLRTEEMNGLVHQNLGESHSI